MSESIYESASRIFPQLNLKGKAITKCSVVKRLNDPSNTILHIEAGEGPEACAFEVVIVDVQAKKMSVVV